MTKHNDLAFVFPGQGSQQLGMLKEAASHFSLIEKTFKEASSALGKDLWALAQNGPLNEINSTMNTQPLLLTAGVALWRVWHEEGGISPGLMAGHSLGEYTALVCANAITLEEGVNLVKQRATFMQEAVPEGQGAMAAILGLADPILKDICHTIENQHTVVAPVNFNAIGQTVIAGNKQAVEEVCVVAKEHGAKVIMLPVSVPSHCALMVSAAMQLSSVLQKVHIKTPQIPVIHNVDVKYYSDPDQIRLSLVKQLSHPVKWVQTIQRFASEGIKTVIECGPGKVLTGLIKRTEPSITSLSIESKAGFDEALAKYLVLG